jgi:predicted acetyltransferase
MNIIIRKATLNDNSVLRNLIEFYCYDFSEYTRDDVNEHGRYEYEWIDHYWTNADRNPFLITVDGQYAGFVLVRDIMRNGETIHTIAEFFVMRKYRRIQVGKTAAVYIFGLFPGTWQINQIEENLPAQAFWRKIIAEYTRGDYQETRVNDWDGPTQIFKTRAETNS